MSDGMGWDGMGWSSKVTGILNAPSLLKNILMLMLKFSHRDFENLEVQKRK